MTIKDAVEKAIEGGWTPKFGEINWATYGEGESTVRVPNDSFLLQPSFWRALGKTEGWEDTDDYERVTDGTMEEIGEQVVKDHGKELGVTDFSVLPQNLFDGMPQWFFFPDSWQGKMHKLTQHLIDGGTIEDFFTNL